MNGIRTKTLLSEADVVVVRFGEKYRQWNAAFDAGYAAALGKPLITLHPPAVSHMLKEVNASANVVCEEDRSGEMRELRLELHVTLGLLISRVTKHDVATIYFQL